MLHRKLDQFCAEKRPVWVFLRDQQRWVEEATVVAIEGDLVTLRYDAEDEEETHTWEESVRIESIGAVSTRLAYVCRSGGPDDVITSEDCPEAERLSNP